METGTRVEAVSRRPDGSYAVSVRRGGTSETVAADHVVISVPFTLLRGEGGIRLDASFGIPEVQRRAIRELGYGTNSKLMVGFARRLWRAPELPYHSNGSTLTDLPYQLCWETSRLQPGTSGILTNFTGGRHGLEIGEGTPEHQAGSSPATSTASSRGSRPSGCPKSSPASSGRPSPGAVGATPATSPGSGPPSPARRGGGWKTSTSPASTPRRTRRGSWKAAASPESGWRERSWGSPRPPGSRSGSGPRCEKGVSKSRLLPPGDESPG